MKKLVSLFLTTVVILSLFVGCGSSKSTMEYSMDNAAAETAPQEVQEEAKSENGLTDTGSGSNEINLPEGKKIILNADLYIETLDFDSSIENLNKKVSEYKGYISNSNIHGDAENASRRIELTIRIPAKDYYNFVNSSNELGTVKEKNEYTEDVTFQYMDVEVRLETLRLEETKLLELLEKAVTIEDVIALEARLSDVRYEIESFEANKRRLDDEIDYSTIILTIREKTKIIAVQPTFLSRLGNVFIDSAENFVEFLEIALFTGIYLLPFGIVALIVVLVIIVIIRKSRKNKK